MEVEVKGKSWSRGGQEEGISLSDIGWFRSRDGSYCTEPEGQGRVSMVTGIRGERFVSVEVKVRGWSQYRGFSFVKEVEQIQSRSVVWLSSKEQCPVREVFCLLSCSTSSYMRDRRPEGVSWYDFVVLRSNIEEGLDSEEEQWVTDSGSESDTSGSESDTSEFGSENGQ